MVMNTQARSVYSVLSLNLACVSLIMAMAITMAFAPSLLKSYPFLLHQRAFPASILRVDAANISRLANKAVLSSDSICNQTENNNCRILQPLVVCGPSGVGKVRNELSIIDPNFFILKPPNLTQLLGTLFVHREQLLRNLWKSMVGPKNLNSPYHIQHGNRVKVKQTVFIITSRTTIP